VLPQDIDVGLRDGVRIKHAVGLVAVLRALCRSYTAVDDEMGNVNALGSQFPRSALCESAEGEFTHRKRRRICEPFDACRRTGQQDGAATARSHVLGGLLRDQECAEGIYAQGVRHGGRVEFRNDRTGIIHTAIGKASFDDDKLRDNFAALMDAIVRAKPSGAKGTYVKTVTVAATMGPGIPVDPVQAARLTVG